MPSCDLVPAASRPRTTEMVGASGLKSQRPLWAPTLATLVTEPRAPRRAPKTRLMRDASDLRQEPLSNGRRGNQDDSGPQA